MHNIRNSLFPYFLLNCYLYKSYITNFILIKFLYLVIFSVSRNIHNILRMLNYHNRAVPCRVARLLQSCWPGTARYGFDSVHTSNFNSTVPCWHGKIVPCECGYKIPLVEPEFYCRGGGGGGGEGGRLKLRGGEGHASPGPQQGGLGERCTLPYRGLGWSPSRFTTFTLFESQNIALLRTTQGPWSRGQGGGEGGGSCPPVPPIFD